ncbi:hypothetical protein FHR99_002582 [Litorivivens lipolytica]|uniref:Uncharacterized protein n=1 Tax=Litorivivens lipolytica TaxID=1524264 RepID=A0A7W4W6C0_9GAMM|nr:hypothetical protein [Litorivivens lipolytica]MBB3048308.1 hypothetical protein [Litorivivens lipolytica]
MLKSHCARAVLAVLTLSVCPLASASEVNEFQDFLPRVEWLPAPHHPAARIELASTDDLSPMLNSMLALYSQLLTLSGGGSSGIELTRLQARIGNDVGKTTDLIDINDVLAADLTRVELVAISADQLQSLGVSAADVQKLPALSPLTDQVKNAMMELPQGLTSIQGPVALAVWGQGGLASMVIRAN